MEQLVPLEGTWLVISFFSLNEVSIIRSHVIVEENLRGIHNDLCNNRGQLVILLYQFCFQVFVVF